MKTKAKSRAQASKSKKREKPESSKAALHCVECDDIIPAKEQALFVEEEVGRFFCQESCIVAHFTKDIEKLEREYGKNVAPHDLGSDERERYAHLRWMNIENPSEVWREALPTGDYRYTLVSEYAPEGKRVYAVAICLMLRGEPSFLFLAFVTGDTQLVDVFRRGEPLKKVSEMKSSEESTPIRSDGSDRLAEPWTEADSVRASLTKSRKENDIPTEDFGFYQKCLEETLQNPNELWSYTPKAAKTIYHFIKRYEHDQSFWYVVIAKDTADASQIEIVDVFPTRDSDLIEMCRHGKREALTKDQSTAQDSTAETKTRRNVH